TRPFGKFFLRRPVLLFSWVGGFLTSAPGRTAPLSRTAAGWSGGRPRGPPPVQPERWIPEVVPPASAAGPGLKRSSAARTRTTWFVLLKGWSAMVNTPSAPAQAVRRGLAGRRRSRPAGRPPRSRLIGSRARLRARGPSRGQGSCYPTITPTVLLSGSEPRS